MAQEPIEIKVNVAGDVGQAVAGLELGEGAAREIYFLEDLTPGLASRHPLLTAGVVLRLRRGSDGDGDSTVKLRPCRRSALTADWLEPWEKKEEHEEYRIEGDWTASRRVLAASLVHDLSASILGPSLDEPAPLFSTRQLELLQACAAIRINLSTLDVLGPIAATRWTKIAVGPVKKVNAERWRVGPLDFLELSLRVDRDDAPTALAELTVAALRAGLTLDDRPASKTEQVLDVLAEG